MEENGDDEEKLKAKVIRRKLLLRTDQELKTKKNLNVKIDSKTIQELNQAYNSYTILLSEASPIYSNYVQIIQEIYPIMSHREIKPKEITKVIEEDQLMKSLNSSFESSPVIEFIPKKIDLGEKKLSVKNKDSIKNKSSPKILEEIHLKENKDTDDSKIKSTKPGIKGLAKIIDKMVYKKLLNNQEDDDNIVKYVMNLRKYCSKFIKRRKRNKKLLKQSSPPLSPKNRNKDKDRKKFEKPKLIKMRTLHSTNTLALNTFVFGNKDKDNNLKKLYSYEDKNQNLNIHFNTKIFGKENHFEKKESNSSNEKKFYKFGSLKNLETIKENVKEKRNSEKRRKFRGIQTINLKNKSQFINKLNQEKDTKKSDNLNALKQINEILKEPIVSTKSSRPSKLVIINNNINNANIILNKDYNKKHSLVDSKISDIKKEKATKVKHKNQSGGGRNSLRKIARNTVKYLNPEFSKFRLPSG